jgi:hypothetical protein
MVKRTVNPVGPKASLQAANVYRNAKIQLKVSVTDLELPGNSSLLLCSSVNGDLSSYMRAIAQILFTGHKNYTTPRESKQKSGLKKKD